MNWNQRYASDEFNFEDMVKQTLQKEADEKMDHHGSMVFHHTQLANDHEEGSLPYHLHLLAADAHKLASGAWNSVWNHTETPNEEYPEYSSAMDHSLRVHARNSSDHAKHLSNMAEGVS